MTPSRLGAPVLLAAAGFSSSALANTGPLGEALFKIFAIWCGIPALILGAAGALLPRLGYLRSLGALMAIILLEFVGQQYLMHTKYPGLRWQLDELIVWPLLASLYAALFHAFSFKVTRVIRRIAGEDDAALYKRHVTDAQQNSPPD